MADLLNQKLSRMLAGMNNPANKEKINKMVDLIKSGKADELLKNIDINDKGKLADLAKKMGKLSE